MNTYEALRSVWGDSQLVALVPLAQVVADRDESNADYPYVIIETEDDNQESQSNKNRFDIEQIKLTVYAEDRRTVIQIRTLWRNILTEVTWPADGFISCQRIGGNIDKTKGIYSADDSFNVATLSPE